MIPEMTPTEFVRRRDSGEEMTLLDVREPSEVAEASVPGALHIPMAQVPHRLQELDPGREVVVLCRSGGRSFQVAMYLRQQGFERVANLQGGILQWRREIED
jgi:rhodanese-related sulfurtransferase